MDAKLVQEMLLRGRQCDHAGNRLEALNNYEDATEIIANFIQTQLADVKVSKRKVWDGRIKEYTDRIAQIKRDMQPRNIIDYMSIGESSTGNSYRALFGHYLNADVCEVLLVEPYLEQRHHFQNLVTFFELLVKKCPNLKYVRLVTKPKNDTAIQKDTLDQVTGTMADNNVRLSLKFIDGQHDRKIFLNNGYTIKIGLGLHIYKIRNTYHALGINDYDFRECKRTEMEISRTAQRESSNSD